MACSSRATRISGSSGNDADAESLAQMIEDQCKGERRVFKVDSGHCVEYQFDVVEAELQNRGSGLVYRLPTHRMGPRILVEAATRGSKACEVGGSQNDIYMMMNMASISGSARIVRDALEPMSGPPSSTQRYENLHCKIEHLEALDDRSQ
jgi:hypothetical protein